MDVALTTIANAATESRIEDNIKSEEDFELFFRQHYANIHALCHRILGNLAEADEAATEAFLQLHRNQQNIHTPLAWLKRCAISRSLDRLRQSQRRRFYEFLTPKRQAPLPDTEAAARQELTHVRKILAAIPKRDAELLLARSEGFTYQEIAAQLNLNPNSVGKLMSRAETHFKQRYEALYGKR